MNKYRPRRSLLFMPASNARAIEKAKTLGADCIIFDLEDAVAPEEKISARAALCESLEIGGFGTRELVIRINTIDSEWFDGDILAAIKAKPDAILVPKISSKSQIIAIDEKIRANNEGASIDIWAMIETPMAIVNINEIASAAQNVPLKSLVLGTNDLAKDIGAKLDTERKPFLFAMSALIMAARAYGTLVFDGVFNQIKDLDGFEAQTIQAKDFGFDGKSLIHPSQIETCNNIFSPNEGEILEAKAIIEAFSKPENDGKGVISLGGKMYELLHLEMARKTIELSK